MKTQIFSHVKDKMNNQVLSVLKTTIMGEEQSSATCLIFMCYMVSRTTPSLITLPMGK